MPRRRNRRLNAKKRIKREFFKAPIFTKKKRAIFKTLKKARVFQKSGKNSGKSAFFTQNSAGSRGPRVKDPIWVFFLSFCFLIVWSSKGRSLWRLSSVFEVCKGKARDSSTIFEDFCGGASSNFNRLDL